MCSNKSGDISEESQESVVDTDSSGTAKPQVSSSSESESSNSTQHFSDSESTTISHERKRYSDEHEATGENFKVKRSQCSSPKRKRINYESVSSLSVSSSPETTVIANGEDTSGENFLRSLPSSRSRLSAFHSNEQIPTSLRNSSILIPIPVPMSHSAIMSRMQQDLRNKAFTIDHNHNHNSNQKERHHSCDSNSDEADNVKRSSSTTARTKLSFGMDRILSDENSSPESIPQQADVKIKECGDNVRPSLTSEEPAQDPISKLNLVSGDLNESIRHLNLLNHHHHPQFHSHHHHQHSNPLNCTDCYFLSRYCRNNSNLPYPSLLVNSSPGAVNATGGGGLHASFSPWMSSSIYENSPLLSPSAYHPQSSLPGTYGLSSSNFSTMSSLVACNTGPGGRRKRSWSRAVFSSLQRKGLEKRFQIQKYITKPDRRQLAATLGLTDAQVKVWFQNRRMKWRHSKEGKVTSGVGDGISSINSTPSSTMSSMGSVSTTVADKK